jgi:hypothetical protein
MIVRPAAGLIHLITQPDHAALSYRIMERWASLADHPRRDAILRAVAEHDNGWREPDAKPDIDPRTGRVVDFVNAPASVKQEVWPRGVARLAGNPWTAALVAQHAITVYDRYRTDREWTAFFAEMEASRNGFIYDAGQTLDVLRRDYVFVRLGDLISLTFCTAWADDQRLDGWCIRLSGSYVQVAPDPFEGREIPIVVSAVELIDKPFRSDTEFRDAWRTAPAVLVRGHARGTPEDDRTRVRR